MKKILPFLLAYGLALALFMFALSSCRTNPDTGETEADWPAIQLGITEASATLHDIAFLYEEPRRGELLALASAVDAANASLETWLDAGGDSLGVAATIAAVLSASQPLLLELAEDEDEQGLLAVLIGVRGAVRVAALFLPATETIPEEV